MSREKSKRPKPRGESTDAEHWGGPTRMSNEGPVMGLEQRGRVRRLHERNNWKQELCQERRESVVLYEEMKVAPSESPCRRRLQTARSCYGPMAAVVNVPG
jgi:hypothetical protein